jgi:hypothetical protein
MLPTDQSTASAHLWPHRWHRRLVSGGALHGWGANAADLVGLAPYLGLTNFSMVFPDAPWPHPQVPGGRMWYSFPVGFDFRQAP